MKSVKVATLKSQLSEYLGKVEAGAEFVITSHNHPIARVVPYRPPAKLEIQLPMHPMRGLKSLRGVQPRKPIDPVALLLEERDRR
ncbi:MAG: hypothetical protein PCFJNLEI_01601 [Verrucomicrobiae bacterium]|nr:hypothetical protein [Verrucomicrobiae bacterium]